MKQKALVSWSGGKDSAWALHLLRQRGEIDVVGLLTTVNREYDRVCIHGTRRDLLEEQAEQCGLPLWPVTLPNPCSNEEYEDAMGAAMRRAKEEGISYVAFGDLFLEEVKNYRISKMAGTGIEPIFPLWLEPTRDLAESMVKGGLKAVVVSVDPNQLDPSFLGRAFDAQFLRDLPSGVNPCGENGEFHTFVYEAPVFFGSIPVHMGETVERDQIFYKELQKEVHYDCMH